MRKALKLLLIVCLIAGLMPVAKLAAKADVVDDMDKLFRTTIAEVFDYENISETQITAEKNNLYDVDLNELGMCYDFTYESERGFALIILDDEEIKVSEIYTNESSPYSKDYKSIYVTQGVYWYYIDGVYYDCITNIRISETALQELSLSAFRGMPELQYSTETVNYLYRTENKYNILSSIPAYIYGKDNGCVPIAGTNLIAYYDKTYTNLIPNYEPGKTVLGTYRFNQQNETMEGVYDQLHVDMGTNIGGAGTTALQFRSGFQKYVKRAGYSVSFDNLMSWGNFDFSAAKSAVQAKKGIALFIHKYKALTITQNDNQDVLTYEYTNSDHAIAGFGCLEVNYTFADDSTRTDKYIHGSLGLGIYKTGYINVDMVDIATALAITIS